MKIKKTIFFFWKTFLHIQVIGFLLLGAGTILLTFFTSNNALEIAISAIASVFIGIGVNNYSTLQTQEQTRRKLIRNLLHATQTLEFVKNRITKLHSNMHERTTDDLKRNLEELEDLLEFTVHAMGEEENVMKSN